MLFSTRKNGSNNFCRSHIPRITTGKRITKMPGECNKASSFVMGNSRCTNMIKLVFVKARLVTQLDSTKVSSKNCRILSANGIDIRSVELSCILGQFPGISVKKVILMAVHNLAVFYKSFKTV